jgi:hypothetical protein
MKRLGSFSFRFFDFFRASRAGLCRRRAAHYEG